MLHLVKQERSSSGPAGEDNSLVIILQTLDSEENDNTIKIILGFNSPLEGEFGNPSEEFEILGMVVKFQDNGV